MIINVAKSNINWTDYGNYRDDDDDYESADDIREKLMPTSVIKQRNI